MQERLNVLALDFDGVVADSMPLQEIAWQNALALVMPPVEKSVNNKIIENLWAGNAGQRMFANVELTDKQKEIARFEKNRIWKELHPQVKIMPGIKNALGELSQHLPIYIATTAPRSYVEEILKRESLAKYFRGIVTDHDVIHPKPAPDLLEKIAESASTGTDKIILIGDTSTDMEMAQSAGSQFLLLDVHARNNTNNLNVRIARSWEEATIFVLAQTVRQQAKHLPNL